MNPYSTILKASAEVACVNLREKEVADREAGEKVRKEAEESKRKDELKARFDSAQAEMATSIATFKRLAVANRDSHRCIRFSQPP